MERMPNPNIHRQPQESVQMSATKTTTNTEAKASAMDLQGNVENFKLPDIFQLLATGRKSGTLGIQREDDIVMVYFDSGLIIYGYGPQQMFHIGRLLKECGKITEAQLDEAVLKQSKSETNQRLGQILIELGHIDRADVMEVVRSQVEELLYSLMNWQTGSFKFYEDQFPTQEEITVDISAENVILEGLRRLDEMNHLRDTLPDMNSQLAISQTGDGHSINVSLSPEEWNLLALIDGHRTITDVVDISNLSEIETLKKLAALKLAGLICVVRKYANLGMSSTAKTTTESQAVDMDKALTGGTDRLEGMMTRLSGLLEDFLQGSGSPSSTLSASTLSESTSSAASMSGAGSSTRLVGDKPLTEILAESAVQDTAQGKVEDGAQKSDPESDSDEEKMWNEFTG